MEGSRFVKVRWELSDDDFSRIWTFCALLFLARGGLRVHRQRRPGKFRQSFSGSNPRRATRRRLGQRADRRRVDPLAADDFLPVRRRAGVQLRAQEIPLTHDFVDYAAAMEAGEKTRPAAAQSAA